MKLSKAEEKAVKFMIFIVALSAFARWRKKPEPQVVDTSAVVTTPQVSATTRSSGPLDPNTATLVELDRLPGIGRTTAARIIENRPYRDLSELGKIIGARRALQLQSRLSLPRGAPLERVKREDEKRARAALQTQRGAHSDAKASTRAGPLYLNRATAKELDQLPGIGPAVAARILARRDSLRGYQSWEQLDSVSGIGPALLKKLKERVVL